MAKYSVGQEVLFRSHYFPEHWNKRVIIERIVQQGDIVHCRNTGHMATVNLHGYTHCYILDLVVARDAHSAECVVEEFFLFPVPDLSEDSFEEMMEKLKNPVDVCP